MDHFGIGAAISGLVAAYTTVARRTGRTTSLVESVKAGDRIIFATKSECDRVRRLIFERGILVECVVADPCNHPELWRIETGPGRTLFDHTWVELYYRHALQQATDTIDTLQGRMSGEGPAHRETRRRAVERQKWRP